jgi:hypothetical protein
MLRHLVVLAALAAWGCGEPALEVEPWGGFGDPGADGTPKSKGPAGTCTYPDGPYGVDEGHTMPLTLSWQGYRPGADAMSTLSAAELFDCDGTRGIHALLFVTSQFGCEPCYLESEALESLMASWSSMGVVASVMLVDDVDGGPPSPSGALLWKEELGLTRVGVFLDPTFSLVVGASVGTPMQTVVDPRTMRVVQRFEGLPDDLQILHALAVHNGG